MSVQKKFFVVYGIPAAGRSFHKFEREKVRQRDRRKEKQGGKDFF